MLQYKKEAMTSCKVPIFSLYLKKKYFEWVGYFGASIAKHKVFLYLENQVSVYISDFDGHLICKDNNSEKKPKGPI